MELTTSQAQGNVPVSVIRLSGALDAATYTKLVDAAQNLFDQGARALVLDMTDLTFMSSAGLAALHITTKIFKGEKAPDAEDGWATFRTMDRERSSGVQHNVKLVGPNEKILYVLDMAGFKQLYEIFADQAAAVASF